MTIFLLQVVGSMDAMKYSMEDKYRSPYMPPSSLAMSMYSDPKYMDSSSKSYLERGYLDSTSALTKAYFESSKMYMDGKYNTDGGGTPTTTRPSYPLDIGKMYTDTSPTMQQQQQSLGSPRSSDSPDAKQQQQERQDGASSSSSTTTSSAGASPGANTLPGYYPSTAAAAAAASMPSGLLPMAQYAASQYHNAQAPGGEFRRPLTVIF